ncbi:MAG TPA: hypothetical protein DCR93_29765 [Cytophagales bacterium]|nr:hypothetical protein [Cytophagales bacterium]HAP63506.1 hypothetical protein [Cytophagales bacterium]
MVFSEGYLVDAVYYHKSGLVNYEDYLVDEVVISSDLIIFKNEREILFLEKNNVENLKLKRQ